MDPTLHKGTHIQIDLLWSLLLSGLDAHGHIHQSSNIKSIVCDSKLMNFSQQHSCVLCLQVQKHDPNWLPSSMMMDANDAEITATTLAFELAMPTFICHWHWQRSKKLTLLGTSKLEGTRAKTL